LIWCLDLAIYFTSGKLFDLLEKTFNLAIHFTSGKLFIFWQINLTWHFNLSSVNSLSSGNAFGAFLVCVLKGLMSCVFHFVFGRFCHCILGVFFTLHNEPSLFGIFTIHSEPFLLGVFGFTR
jgi:hypothetical protein